MLRRYKKNSNGSNVPIAEVYTANEHGIDPKNIDLDAIWAVRKLKQSGAEAYIVGGAVRDLLLHHKPKDFDISTSATPRQVQKLFWNARIIGKRFKLVHLVFKDKILEVSTFRSGADGHKEGQSIYGTVEQDAKRRDFTINSLYYDPIEGQLIDFNHAMLDFKRKRIRSIIPLSISFVEDPVRMIRAVKYAVVTGFSLQFDIRRALKKNMNELARISDSRLTEEVSKILCSGQSAAIIAELQRYKLLVYLLPCISVYTDINEVFNSLRTLDKKVLASKIEDEGCLEGLKGEMLEALVKPIIRPAPPECTPQEAFKEIFGQIKTLISPITPPNYNVEQAAVLLLEGDGITVPKNCLRARKPLRQFGSLGARAKGHRQVDGGRKRKRPSSAASRSSSSKKRRPTSQKKSSSPAKISE